MPLIRTKAEARTKSELAAACGLGLAGLGCDTRIRISQDFSLPLCADGALNRVVFSFLLGIARVREGLSATTTCHTYGESLQLWLDFLAGRECEWSLPTARLLSSFRQALASGELTGRISSSRTIRLRQTVVMEFYRFVMRSIEGGEEWIAGLVQDQPIIRFIHQSEKTSSARIYARKPRALSATDIELLLGKLKSPHDLIFKWTLCTGLRRSTAVQLTMGQITAAKRGDFSVLEFRSKGGKIIDVIATSELIRETQRYIQTRRRIWLRGSEQQYVFVGERGTRTSSAAFYHAFRRAALSAGVKAHPHMARHTFAARIHTVATRLSRKGSDINPEKFAQRLLGHSSAATTAAYLESIGAAEGDALGILAAIQREFLGA